MNNILKNFLQRKICLKKNCRAPNSINSLKCVKIRNKKRCGGLLRLRKIKTLKKS